MPHKKRKQSDNIPYRKGDKGQSPDSGAKRRRRGRY